MWMAGTAYEEESHRFVNKLLNLDFELNLKMYEKDLQVKDIYEIVRQRLSLYEQATEIPLIESDRLLLNCKKSEVLMELRMFKLKQDIKKQVDDVLSRIDVIENQYITREKNDGNLRLR